MILLTADWHLTDRPQDEYRWTVFSTVKRLIAKHSVREVFMLGDLADKKDRHSGAFVNRVVDELRRLECAVTIIMGNHDAPLSGTPVWQVVNKMKSDIVFHTQPLLYSDIALLPFAAHPDEAWADINFKKCKAVFIHQPVDGAKVNGHPIKGSAMPIFPRGIKIYAGDVHVPQIVGRVHYVGAPHHIDFGDDYKCRMLVIDPNTFEIIAEEILTPPGKELVEIGSIEEIHRYDLQPGDQIKVRLSLNPEQLKDYAAQERALMDWAKGAGVHVTALETRVFTDERQSGEMVDLTDANAALATWIERERLDDARAQAGQRFLNRALGK